MTSTPLSLTLGAAPKQLRCRYSHASTIVATYLCNLVIHNLLIRHIALVAHEELVDTLRRISVDLLQPLLDVVE
jgi:hypothetical protein